MSPLRGLVSLKQTLKSVHIIFNTSFALTRIKQALFFLQNIIFWVVLQHDWCRPWRREWNSALGPASHKCHPHLPLPARSSLALTRPRTQAPVQLHHSCRHCWLCRVQLYPEVTRWDVFRGYRNHWSIFQQRSAVFQLFLELLPSAIIFPPSLHFESVCLSIFPLYSKDLDFSWLPMTDCLTVCTKPHPSKSLYHCRKAEWLKLAWQWDWKKIHSAFVFRYLISSSRNFPIWGSAHCW